MTGNGIRIYGSWHKRADFHGRHSLLMKKMRKKQPLNGNVRRMERDSFTMSSEAKKIQESSRVYEQTDNIKFDRTVDIKAYFDKAICENQNNIENPRAEIPRSCMGNRTHILV